MNSDQSKQTPTPVENLYEEVDDAISSGPIAEVFKIKRTSDNTIFAKKIIKLSDLDSAQEAYNELEKFKSISHPNLA